MKFAKYSGTINGVRKCKKVDIKNLIIGVLKQKLRSDKQTNIIKGSFRCGKNCIACRYITDGHTDYAFSATVKMRTVHDRIDSKNLIYMIYCLGETKRRLKDRFNEQQRPVDRPAPSSRPTAVSDRTFISWRFTQSQGSVPYRKGSNSWIINEN